METSPLPVSAADLSPSLYNSHENMHKTTIKKIKIISSRTFLYYELTNAKTERKTERETDRQRERGVAVETESPQKPSSMPQLYQ